MMCLRALLLCGVLLAPLPGCGDEPPTRAPSPSPAPVSGPVAVPLPPLPPPPPPGEQARGVYLLETPALRAALTLEADGRFRFVSKRPGQAQRLAEGTWSLSGTDLTLVYTHLEGEPLPEGPQTAVNLWGGDTVGLRDTGLAGTVVLHKRAMIRGGGR